MLAVSPLGRAAEEKLWAGTLPPPHSSLPDVLHGVLTTGLGIAWNVERVNACGVMFGGANDRLNGETHNWNGTVMTYNEIRHRCLHTGDVV